MLTDVELHQRDSQRAFLNPAIVLTAVATWEWFTVDLACAASTPCWSVEDSGWDRGFDATVPWPGSYAETKHAHRWGDGHHLDAVLITEGVLDAPLTSGWRLRLATSWSGADPQNWVCADYAASPPEEHRDVIRQAMQGSKSARDAAAHRLYYKKAREAAGYYRQGMNDDEVDQRNWCYVWQGDNAKKSGHTDETAEDDYLGKPTIQHGYARGVVVLCIQLIDDAIAVIQARRGWRRKNSRPHHSR